MIPILAFAFACIVCIASMHACAGPVKSWARNSWAGKEFNFDSYLLLVTGF